MAFQDHFSNHASVYAGARPGYPRELFRYLASLCEHIDIAWDCACGNGQASIGLGEHFATVLASDASLEQLLQAPEVAGIQYINGEAETRFLAAASVDLVCVAQALHWFDTRQFFQIAVTVLKPRAVLAAWCYGLTRISDGIDELIDYLYEPVLGPYWPPERKLVENSYQDLEFPFHEITAPGFAMEKDWSLDELLAYLESWSALQRYIKANEKNPLADLKEDFKAAWGSAKRRQIVWPLTLRGR